MIEKDKRQRNKQDLTHSSPSSKVIDFSSQIFNTCIDAPNLCLTILHIPCKPIIQISHITHEFTLLVNGCHLRQSVFLAIHELNNVYDHCLPLTRSTSIIASNSGGIGIWIYPMLAKHLNESNRLHTGPEGIGI